MIRIYFRPIPITSSALKTTVLMLKDLDCNISHTLYQKKRKEKRSRQNKKNTSSEFNTMTAGCITFEQNMDVSKPFLVIVFLLVLDKMSILVGGRVAKKNSSAYIVIF